MNLNVLEKFFLSRIAKKAHAGSFNNFPSLAKLGVLSCKWMDYQEKKNLWDAFCTIPDIGEIINKKSTSYSKIGRVIRVKKTKEIIRDHPALYLLQNPNPIQIGSELSEQAYIDRDLFGSAYYYALTTSEKINYKTIKALYVIPAYYMMPVWTGKIYQQFRLEDIIQHYLLDLRNGQNLEFPTNSILHVKRTNNKNVIFGRSPLAGEGKSLDTLRALYRSDFILTDNYGSIGMLSPKMGKDPLGVQPINEKTRNIVLEDIKNTYGLDYGKFQLMMSSLPMDYTNMIPSVKDLQIDEKHEKYLNKIINALNYQKGLLASTKGDTFTNKNEDWKFVYNESLLPDHKAENQGLTRFFGLDLEGLEIISDISDIEALRADQQKAAIAYRNKSNALKDQYMSGLITMNEWLARLEEDKSKSNLADKYITDLTPKELSIILQLPITQPTQD